MKRHRGPAGICWKCGSDLPVAGHFGAMSVTVGETMIKY